jgi:hypothetical protein
VPERIRLSRKRGWKKPDGTIVVSRPSKWGNPYRVKCSATCWQVFDLNDEVVSSHTDQGSAREAAVKCFERYIRRKSRAEIARLKYELQGSNLACWCPLPAEGQPDICHAAVLLRLANP